MKTLVYLACILAFSTYVNCQLEYLYEIADHISLPRSEMDNCFADSEIKHELETKLYSLHSSAEISPEKVKEIKRKLGCFGWCILEKKGATNGTVLDAPKIHKLFDQFAMRYHANPKSLSQMHQVLQSCLSRVMVIENSCDAAYAFMECFGH